MSKTRLFTIWDNMRRRCYDKGATGYKYYGGRGIKVCKKWQDFIPFKDWALSHGYTDDLTIDRIDNDGNYEPDNCQWITHKDQQKNRRNVKKVKAYA